MEAIKAVNSIVGIETLAHYYLLPATLGELYSQLNEKEKAGFYFEKALQLTQSKKEKNLLIEKLKNLI